MSDNILGNFILGLWIFMASYGLSNAIRYHADAVGEIDLDVICKEVGACIIEADD